MYPDKNAESNRITSLRGTHSACVVALLICLALLFPHVVRADEADLILRGGKVYTVNPRQTWAEAVGIRGDKIVFVGSDEDADKFIGPQTRTLTLQGQLVLPGFQDSHIHPISAMMKSLMCDLAGLPGVQAYLAKVRECAAQRPGQTWLMGAGWSHRYFDEKNPPDKKLLDSVVPDRPVTLVSYDGHSVWANSIALSQSGVLADTPDPKGGTIERYENSREPTGLLLERPATRLVFKAKPDYTNEQRMDALIKVQAYLHSLGVTSIQDAWIEVEDGGVYGTLSTYRQAAETGTLNLRVVGALYWRPDEGMEQLHRMISIRNRSQTGFFRASSVKLWQDGVMHTHTSRLLEDYADRPGERGESFFDSEQLKNIVSALDREGFQVHIHADGDGATREALDAYETAAERNGKRDARHHIAHMELVHPRDLPRLKELGVIANIQPMWSTSRAYISNLIDVKLGEQRRPWMEVNKSFIDQGVTVAYGSDWFVTSANPMDVIEAAVTRIRPALPLEEKRQLKPLLPGEQVSVEQAITSYTINGAYANHQERTTGSIEVGKKADIVVLNQNILNIDPHRISETKVLMTIFNGSAVYDTLGMDE